QVYYFHLPIIASNPSSFTAAADERNLWRLEGEGHTKYRAIVKFSYTLSLQPIAIFEFSSSEFRSAPANSGKWQGLP
ncbi:hypothetical protein LINPERHAP2_LOCUS16010, partial [Linum perenne]